MHEICEKEKEKKKHEIEIKLIVVLYKTVRFFIQFFFISFYL